MTALTVAQMADVLDKAVAYLDQYGWLQGDFAQSDKECPACAVGAINAAMFGTPHPLAIDGTWTETDEVAEVVVEQSGIEGFDLAAWNDIEGRTKEEVTEALRSTAVKLRKLVAA
ncbi:DUF6197 family protein [Streptomyces sp. BH104]|uniref:DUF6197 family protein n=1 Tax=Streptomyces sp. BH104 TaxID=3410407 RepID=UPI003BB7C4D7